MVTYEEEPTIRFAISGRLDKEPRVELCEIQVKPHLKAEPPYIAVGVLCRLGKLLVHKSVFHLPAQFQHGHLLNEIDEIAESCKAARREFFKGGMVVKNSENHLPGTGLRGNWARYG